VPPTPARYGALVLWLPLLVLLLLTCVPSAVTDGAYLGQVLVPPSAEGGAWDRLITEAADLQTREAEACHHAEEAEKIVLDLSERARKDGEDAAQAVRERDELRRWDAESRQQILNLQGKLKKEKGLKLAA
jgi:hypothetical protein